MISVLVGVIRIALAFSIVVYIISLYLGITMHDEKKYGKDL